MLPHQTPGISLNQALVFMRDVKIFASDGHFGKKSAIFDNTPVEKRFGPWIFCTVKLSENLISTIWDRFHGGASLSYDPFFSVTDRQIANTELITLLFLQDDNAKF